MPNVGAASAKCGGRIVVRTRPRTLEIAIRKYANHRPGTLTDDRGRRFRVGQKLHDTTVRRGGRAHARVIRGSILPCLYQVVCVSEVGREANFVDASMMTGSARVTS
ncbi:hypothetical protein Pla108_17680 [Botrimarina colliarenosi]|uniref:Uncharacterized protein n=1 Tax=Botrimarina colliarenosi TaxID=2528001 RepID=A0A5C6ADY2_9BACT|nr:hypothetical protein Pla108_17680 [Botrimarina colliarenosi]